MGGDVSTLVMQMGPLPCTKSISAGHSLGLMVPLSMLVLQPSPCRERPLLVLLGYQPVPGSQGSHRAPASTLGTCGEPGELP